MMKIISKRGRQALHPKKKAHWPFATGSWPFPINQPSGPAAPPPDILIDEEEVLRRTTKGVDFDFELDLEDSGFRSKMPPNFVTIKS